MARPEVILTVAGLPAHMSDTEVLRPATIGLGLTVKVDVAPVTVELQLVAVKDTELIVIVVEPADDSVPVEKLAAPVPPLVVIDALLVPVFAPLSV